jgi:hypothetical protein
MNTSYESPIGRGTGKTRRHTGVPEGAVAAAATATATATPTVDDANLCRGSRRRQTWGELRMWEIERDGRYPRLYRTDRRKGRQHIVRDDNDGGVARSPNAGWSLLGRVRQRQRLRRRKDSDRPWGCRGASATREPVLVRG